MFNHNWFVPTVVLSLLLSYRNFFITAQSQNAIGAHRSFQKTSFSCAGRPAGYYADVETGCQVYHMCDGLGRQFSYSCPNTTLFQQRMLICDHWYMVNCSKAESDYTANLLIGQRDKPFVNEEENNLRTPRPDLLDRPYAPDYSGESFRSQYQKSLSSVLNQIYDTNSYKKEKSLSSSNQPTQPTGQQRWKIPPPSRLILPPAYEPQIPDNTVITTTAKSTTRISYYNPSTTTTTTTTTSKPSPSSLRPTSSNSRSLGTRFNGVAALHNRHDEHLQYELDDLGTSHSTRYNTSADFNSNEDRNQKNRGKNAYTTTKSSFGLTTLRTTTSTSTSTTKATANPSIKIPSKIYEPPVLFPIYNLEDSSTTTTTTTVRPLFRASTAAPFMTRQTTTTTRPTTTRPPSRATTMLGKPFTRSSSITAPTTTTQSGRNLNRFDADKLSKELRTPAPAQGFKIPTPRPTVSAFNTSKSIAESVPSKHLLPPLVDFVQHDVATTQGPPIYYEWKVPSDGLEPPKMEVPIGVDGRQYPETVLDYNSISASGTFSPNPHFGIDQKKEVDSRPTLRPPTSRSVKETAQPNGVSTRRKADKPTKATGTAPTSSNEPEDIFQISKDLSVPEYAFPLENVGRTGYLDSDVYNSFQLKIPERRADTDEHLHWFGENPKCPECHPSYVIPGTCEPCLRR
ncbi:mucin-2 [Stomoxys calcitrans]|uniref:mucin-2 n=1 Tax=Stomoxys calcitrans TaxID=35570 RepID=UPI0027E31C1C|nr:mucin-2 [Stomoxys calcitrans]XP_013099155.2 mucin-2 [Stomoxys calcitrans]XP_013099156.2 mucin-2 [Stomoxys calcitrans]XP_059219053.1 mucin-2 [Stomoxys calcitrans]